jgi:hypothetical protein
MLLASQKHPGPVRAGGHLQILCGRWLKPNFLREDPKLCAAISAASCFLFAFSSRFLEDWAGNIPSSGWSGGSWRRCPQPGRILANAWYSLLNLQQKRAAATAVQLKLLTAHGTQDSTQWQNLHNLPPPRRRNLSRAYPRAVAQRWILSLRRPRMSLTPHEPPAQGHFSAEDGQGHHQFSRDIRKHHLRSLLSSRARVHSSHVTPALFKRLRPT